MQEGIKDTLFGVIERGLFASHPAVPFQFGGQQSIDDRQQPLGHQEHRDKRRAEAQRHLEEQDHLREWQEERFRGQRFRELERLRGLEELTLLNCKMYYEDFDIMLAFANGVKRPTFRGPSFMLNSTVEDNGLRLLLFLSARIWVVYWSLWILMCTGDCDMAFDSERK